MAVTSFDPDRLKRGTEIVTPWVKFTLTAYPSGADVQYVLSDRSHSDVANYDNYKSGQVISFGHVIRKLSSYKDGQLQAAQFGFSVYDDANPVSGIGSLMTNLHSTTYQNWYNRIAEMKIIGSTGRLAVDDPMVLTRGYITKYGFVDDTTCEFLCDDYLTAEFSAFNAQKKLPWRLTGAAQHADCPPENLGFPEPIIYGEVTDAPHGNNGAIPLLYIGTEVISSATWGKLLVAGHAMSDITGWHSGGVLLDPATIGVDFLVPGYAGYPGGVKYRDIGGRRYSIIYARNAYLDNHINGTALLSCNGKGIEATGDGTGALIDDIALQYQHLLINFVFQNYLTGNWLSNPIWSPGFSSINKVNAATFTTVKNQHHARLPFPFYRGAIVLGPDGQIAVRDAIALLNLCCDCQSGFDPDNQYCIFTDDAIATTADLTDQHDLLEGPIPIQPDTSLLFNEFPFVYRPSQTAQQAPLSSMRACQPSKDAHLATRRIDSELLLKWTRDDATAQDIVDHWGGRWKDPPRYFTLRMGLHGTSRSLGEWIRVTDTKLGWNLRTMRIEGIDIDVDGYAVNLLVRDMTATGVSATMTTVPYDTRSGGASAYSTSGSTVITTISTALAFGTQDAGGSMHQGSKPTTGTYADVEEFEDVEVDWNIFASFNAYFRVDAATQDAGTSVTPSIHDLSAVGADTVHWDGAAATNVAPARGRQTIKVTPPPSGGIHTYRLQVKRGANTNAFVYAKGICKMAA